MRGGQSAVLHANDAAHALIDTTLHESSDAPERLRKTMPSTPTRRAAPPEAIAETIRFASLDAASDVIGSVLRVVGGR